MTISDNMNCRVRYSLSQAREYDRQGFFIPAECVDRSFDFISRASGALDLRKALQDRYFDEETGLYTIYYSLTGFEEREVSERTPSRETVTKAMAMIEKDLCFKFREVNATYWDSYHLHLYGNSI